MERITSKSIQVVKNRSYMKAIRALMGYGQYTVVRKMKDPSIIRESEISVLDGKIGLKHLWETYGNYYEREINDSELDDDIKEVMRTLLEAWRRA